MMLAIKINTYYYFIMPIVLRKIITIVKKLNVKKILLLILYTLLLISPFFLHFKILNFNGKMVLLFSFSGKILDIQQGRMEGTVIGSYKLPTEYGSITVKNFCKIDTGNSYYSILNESFRSGQARHNLDIQGIRPSENINFTAKLNGKIDSIILGESIYGSGEITIAGFPFIAYRIRFEDTYDSEDFLVSIKSIPEPILLADSTEIISDPEWNGVFDGILSVYDEDFLWILRSRGRSKIPILVKKPGDKEFEKYQLIKVRSNWGEFLEGELFEEEAK